MIALSMTETEITDAVTKIAAHEGPPLKDWRAERVRWTEIRGLQRQLADEFGRRNGWQHSDKWFSLCTLVRNGVYETETCPQYPAEGDYIDHPYWYRSKRRARALAVHLYSATGRHNDITAWAASNGMRASFPTDFPSWWYPRWTTLVVYEPDML
jgi:hypothetical protein